MGERGRPAIGPTVTARVTPEQLADIDTLAAHLGMKRAEWLRAAIEAHIRRGFIDWGQEAS